MLVSRSHSTVKARILGLAVVDAVVDVLVPTIIGLALVSAGVPSYQALTAGGVAIGVKASMGRLEDWWGERPAGFDRRAAVAVVAAVVALVALFGLPALGVAVVAAAVVAGLVTAVPVLLALRGGASRVDGIGLLVLAEVAASVVLTAAGDDPRFLLARPAVYTAVAGVGALLSCLRGRPIMLDATKPMAAAGDPVRADAFEAAWEGSARFRTIERAMTAGLGALLLAEAVLRVVIVYTTARPDAVVTGLVAQIPAVALFLVYVLAARVLAVPRVRAIVDGYVRSGSQAGSAAASLRSSGISPVGAVEIDVASSRAGG